MNNTSRIPALTADRVALVLVVALFLIQFAYYFPDLPSYLPNKPSRPQSGMTSKWSMPLVMSGLFALLSFANVWSDRLSLPAVGRLVANPSIWLADDRKSATHAAALSTLRWATVGYATALLVLSQGSYLIAYDPRGAGGLIIVIGIFGVPMVTIAVALWFGWRFRARAA
jgi:hypothetical protein